MTSHGGKDHLLSALCINLGCSTVPRLKERQRVEKVEDFIQGVASQYLPDVVFTQDTFAAKHLEKMTEDLTNNVPLSQFELRKVNIQGQDYVSVLINTNKYEITNIEKETEQVLQKLRISNQMYFNEARAVFVLVKHRVSDQSILLSSFHAKKNKITDIQREKHILEFMTYLENIAVKIRAKHILVGTDINHKMGAFDKINPAENLCVKTFLYDYPEGYGRYDKKLPVYDYFLHSANMCPVEVKPSLFNIPLDILDHHPLHSTFRFETTITTENGTRINAKFAQPMPHKTTPANKKSDLPTANIKTVASQRKLPTRFGDMPTNLPPMPTINNPLPSYNNPMPHNNPMCHISHRPNINSPWPINSPMPYNHPVPFNSPVPYNSPIPHNSPMSHISHQPNINSPWPTNSPMPYTSPMPHNSPTPHNNHIAPTSIFPPIVQHTIAPKSQPNRSIHTSPLSQPIQSKTPTSTNLEPNRPARNSINPPMAIKKCSFRCEICQDSFDTRHGLFIHFGKAMKKGNPHHFCKAIFADEDDDNKRVCLRVFETERGLKQHQTKQASKKSHHAPGKPFPNLIY